MKTTAWIAFYVLAYIALVAGIFYLYPHLGVCANLSYLPC